MGRTIFFFTVKKNISFIASDRTTNRIASFPPTAMAAELGSVRVVPGGLAVRFKSRHYDFLTTTCIYRSTTEDIIIKYEALNNKPSKI